MIALGHSFAQLERGEGAARARKELAMVYGERTSTGFPVVWEQPYDVGLLWTADRVHAPGPLTPMEFDFARLSYEHAIPVAYDFPIRVMLRRINGYLYMATVPATGSADELARQNERSKTELSAAMLRLPEHWVTRWLPEVKQHLEFWEASDVAALSNPELFAHLGETLERTRRMWEIHFRVVLPSLLALSTFDELYRGQFDTSDSLDPYRLLRGFPSATTRADEALWQLSRAADNWPDVRAVLVTSNPMTLADELSTTSNGRCFLSRLGEYLATYGRRNDMVYDLSRPTWLEHPAPVLDVLSAYTRADVPSPSSRLEEQAQERERLVALAHERLQSRPPDIVQRFETMLKIGQEASRLLEEHNFWIDYSIAYHVRCVLLECGRRLARASAIRVPDDVFHLTIGNVLESAAIPDAYNYRAAVEQSRVEMAQYEALSPPAVLGTPLAETPAEGPLARAMQKLLANATRPPESATLTGNPASPGIARGTGRVLRSLAEATRLQPGEVIIAESTTPPWTPLFAIAAAVVTDHGGVLSHCAVAAREYGLPAVVGTGNATQAIRDGQLIEVDGTQGTVRLCPQRHRES
jgi:pyruvate,water dikinase